MVQKNVVSHVFYEGELVVVIDGTGNGIKSP
jgi:ribose 5-phosphate isomerase RpiB